MAPKKSIQGDMDGNWFGRFCQLGYNLAPLSHCLEMTLRPHCFEENINSQ